jgi:hypothetical protein
LVSGRIMAWVGGEREKLVQEGFLLRKFQGNLGKLRSGPRMVRHPDRGQPAKGGQDV